VKVEIQTKIENATRKPAVYIQGSEMIYSVEGVEERIRALQCARNWLKKELARK
jgi:hypothetical protein